MMLEIALSRPEYAPTARNTKLDRYLGPRLLRQGLCGHSGASALDQEHHGGTALDAEDRHARGAQGDLRFLRSRLALRLGTVVARCLMTTHIGLKVDVDTLRGTREGVPRLTALFKKLGVDATFYFSVGPDNTGRALRRVFRKGFAQKVARTSVLKHYGLKTLLYGVLLPGPDIGLKAGGVMRGVHDAGFEVGLHTYDHVRWQDYVAGASEAWTRIEFERGMQAFERVFGFYPKSHAAAGWQINAHALELEREYGLAYASDTRGANAFLAAAWGRRSSCPQLPTTLPTFDELLGRDGIDESTIADAVYRLFASKHAAHELRDRLQVFTLHAELEGMRLLRRLRVAAHPVAGCGRHDHAHGNDSRTGHAKAAARPDRHHGRGAGALGVARRSAAERGAGVSSNIEPSASARWLYWGLAGAA